MKLTKGIETSSEKIRIPIRKTPINSATSKARVDLTKFIHSKTALIGQKLASTKAPVIHSKTALLGQKVASTKTEVVHSKTALTGQKVASTKKPVIHSKTALLGKKVAPKKASVKLPTTNKAPKKSRAVDLSKKKNSSVIESRTSVLTKDAIKKSLKSVVNKTKEAIKKGLKSVIMKKTVRAGPKAAEPIVMKSRSLTAAALKKLAPVVKKTPRIKKPKIIEFKGSEWSGNSDDEGTKNN